MNLDHAVLWVSDASKALEFYTHVLGLEPVRADAFAQGKAKFPSVRLNSTTIFDLMEKGDLLSRVKRFTGSKSAGGTPTNHLCLSVTEAEYSAIAGRLAARSIMMKSGGEHSFGAQGQAAHSFYFNDPDSNVLEIRYYPDE